MDINSWAKKINWDKRIKAVCKPCWEIRYCPYGPMVEYMPTNDKNKEKICRIFGHVCPVYVVAEPFTETKELRTISRSIPREVQLRVCRRDNNVCQLCAKNVLDKDIHFDHIIPWSKGGSSDENNIRILCKKCNLERSDDFESELLVTNFKELSSGLIDITQEMLYDIIVSLNIINKLKTQISTTLSIETILSSLKLTDEQKENAEVVYKLAFELDDFISNYMNEDFTKTDVEKIKYRLGYNTNNQSHSIFDTTNKFKVTFRNIQKIENRLFNFIGLNIKYIDDEQQSKQYDIEMIKEINDCVLQST